MKIKRKTIIIAEAGVNHNGDLSLAKELIDIAAESGADYVKFQSFRAEKHSSPYAVKANYQLETTVDCSDKNQFGMLKKLELSDENHILLIDYCKSKNIKFLSSAFDPDGIKYLSSIGLNVIKIPSGELTNLPYLKQAGKMDKDIWLSCGMGSLGEIDEAINIITNQGLDRNKITLFHCNTEYPTPLEDANLKAIKTLKSTFNLNIGYSDHTMGITVPIAAVALGAICLEKHFTIDRQMKGPDHKASLEPNELNQMVSEIRNIEIAIGDGYKKLTKSEEKNIIAARKSIHLKKSLKSKTHIKEEDLIMLRPGNGISPMKMDSVIGKILIKDCEENYQLSWNDLR